MPKLSKHLIFNISISVLICLIILYLGISAISAYLLLTPKRVFNQDEILKFTGKVQNISFLTSDSINIKGWFIPSEKSDQAIIFIHGMNSSRTAEFGGNFPQFANSLHSQGFNILMIDLRGHGKSGDAFFSFGITERKDTIAAVNWLKTQGFKHQKIGVLGVSMGAATAIAATAENSDIGALVSDSGYAEVYPLMQRQWHSSSGLPNIFLPSTMMFAHLFTGYDLTSSKPVNEINLIAPRPVLIIHSRCDPYTPVSNAQQLKKAYPLAQYWETSVCEHAGSYVHNPELYVKKVANFFRENLH